MLSSEEPVGTCISWHLADEPATRSRGGELEKDRFCWNIGTDRPFAAAVCYRTN